MSSIVIIILQFMHLYRMYAVFISYFLFLCCLKIILQLTAGIFVVVIPFYLQSVLVHSTNCVKTYTMECRRVLTNIPLQLTGSRPLMAFGITAR
jgi:hypothetical protein